jgi:tetratricopeptide (TPR) repeat protein
MNSWRLGLALAALGVAPAMATRYDSGGSTYDHKRVERAERIAYYGRFSEAIAALNDVISSSRDYAYAYYVRAEFYRDEGRYTEALADVARAEAFHPDAAQIAVLRATIALRQHDAKTALKALDQAEKMPLRSVWTYGGLHVYHTVTQNLAAYEAIYSSVAYEMLGQDKASVDAMSQAIDLQPTAPSYVLNAHCFYSAIVGFAEMAELTCNEAIKRQSHEIGDYDSLGLADLKIKAWAKAVKDFDYAIEIRPGLTTSLYGRGVAKHALGDKAGGDADIAAARRDEPDIVNVMGKLGVSAS